MNPEAPATTSSQDRVAAAAPPQDANHNNAGDPTNNINNTVHNPKIDPITALQDGVDSLSLAMFEALRGLRDAVAPESGNLGSNNNNNPQQQQQQESAAVNNSNDNGNNNENDDDEDNATEKQQPLPDAEELWQLYRQGDEGAVSLLQNAVAESESGGEASSTSMPQTREQVAALHRQMERSRDTELVQRLAQTVLQKSRWIDEQLDDDHIIPGMHRTHTEQMALIDTLVQENAIALQQLQTTYEKALQQRAACRSFVKANTCQALGIRADKDEEEEGEDNGKKETAAHAMTDA